MSPVTVEKIEAKRVPGKDLDPSGFFVINIDRARKEIVVEHYENVAKDKIKVATGRLAHVVTGDNASDIGNTILARGMVSQMDHALYLGMELQKAELALNQDWDYTQDEDIVC